MRASNCESARGLRRVEESVREGQESSDKVNRFRRGFYRGRLIFVGGVIVGMTTLSWVALDWSSCTTH
ncbi:MAG: hypothetical protein OSB60_00780 [Myxococcota bacterium]|jgi:hypothetical protein|nr:hypothetical protein [Myxococcota bacterium]